MLQKIDGPFVDGSLCLGHLSASIKAPQKRPQGFLLVEFRQHLAANWKPKEAALDARLLDQRWEMRQAQLGESFCSTSKEASEAHLFCPDFFPTKGKFLCTCKSAILGQLNKQYFNFKILANYQEGGFLLGISGTIPVTAFFFPPPLLSLETSRAQLLHRCNLPKHTNNRFFFSRASFHYFGFLSVHRMSNWFLFVFETKNGSRKMELQW